MQYVNCFIKMSRFFTVFVDPLKLSQWLLIVIIEVVTITENTVLLNTAKNTRDLFAIRVRDRAAYLSSVIMNVK